MLLITGTLLCFTPVKMAIIKQTKNKCWPRYGKKHKTLVSCWWEYKLMQMLWKTAWRFLKKLKIKLSYDSAIPLKVIYPKALKSGSWSDTHTLLLF